MTNENLEIIGQQIDGLENLIAALYIPMPYEEHVYQLKEILPVLVESLKTAFINETGENPWG